MLAGLRARDGLPACFASAIAFAAYLFTLSPTIAFGDSGELITAAYTLGIPHPPGYPLWVILAKLFSFLPIGNAAYRLNLMSALLDSAAVGILTIVISRTLPKVCARIIPREAFESPVAGMITGSASATAALMLAFSPSFWHQSVVAEVYALNNLLVCLILLILVLWAENPQKNALLFAAAFLFGVGQANHQTLLLMGPAIGAYVLLVRPRAPLSPRLVLGCAALFFLAPADKLGRSQLMGEILVSRLPQTIQGHRDHKTALGPPAAAQVLLRLHSRRIARARTPASRFVGLRVHAQGGDDVAVVHARRLRVHGGRLHRYRQHRA
jgi:hypothetical protein